MPQEARLYIRVATSDGLEFGPTHFPPTPPPARSALSMPSSRVRPSITLKGYTTSGTGSETNVSGSA